MHQDNRYDRYTSQPKNQIAAHMFYSRCFEVGSIAPSGDLLAVECKLRGNVVVAVFVPFVFAIGFATAALGYMLSDRFGAIAACSIISAGFTIVGVFGIIAVKATEQEIKVAEPVPQEERGAANSAGVAAGEAVHQIPLALISGIIAAAGRQTSAIGLGRLIGRNLSLLVLATVVGALLMSETTPEAPDDDEVIEAGKPNGSRPADTGPPPPAT